MALPTLSKTWQYGVNQWINYGPFSYPGECSMLLLNLKNTLTGFASNPWSVVASSNYQTAGSGDNWSTPSNVRHENEGSAHSWIVLNQPAISANFQMLFNVVRNSGGNLACVYTYFSESGGFWPSPASGGTILNRPTATDEVHSWAHPNTGQPQWTAHQSLSDNPGWLHVQQSSDGKVTRWWLYINGTCTLFVNVEAPRDPASAWTTPWICTLCTDEYSGTNYYPPGYGILNDLNELTILRGSGGGNAWAYYTSEGCVSAALGQYQVSPADLDSNSYPMFPIGLFSDTPGARGRIGALNDMWWASTFTGDGDYYPADLTRQFVQVGNLILPWNGSAMSRL